MNAAANRTETSADSRSVPRTVVELMHLAAAHDSAAINLLDMIDDGELSRDDSERIATLYEAHR